MKRQNRHRGSSIVEALIATTLALGLFGLVTAAIVFGTRHYQRLLAANELEQECLLIMEGLASEFAESRLQSTEIEAGGLIFPRPRDSSGALITQAGTGVLMWASQACYRWDSGTRSLYRYVEDMPHDIVAIDPFDMTPARDLVYFQSSVAASKLLNQEVADFQANFVVADGPDPDNEPDIAPRRESRFVRLRLVLERPGPKLTRIEVSMNATARN